MNREAFIKRLRSLSVDQIDRLRDENLVAYEDVMVKWYKLKEDELILRQKKSKQYLEDDNSLSKTETLMRNDEDIFNLKLELLKLKPLKLELGLSRDCLKDAFWSARNN